MHLPSDRFGIETIPLRLIVVAAVVAMSVIPAAQALETLKTRDFLARVAGQMDSVISAIDSLSVEGPGSVKTISLDFRSSGQAQFKSFSIGGPPDEPDSMAVKLVLTTGKTLVRSSENADVPIRAATGGTLFVWDGLFDLRLSAQYDGGDLWILAEVASWTS